MDLNVNSFRIVNTLTAETKEDKRSSAARAGGKVGGRARAEKLSQERRKEIARAGSRARWGKKTDA